MKTITAHFKTFLLFSILFSLSALQAQSPNKMSYQAVIRNASNILLTNANVGIQISILRNSPTGTSFFVERHTVATNLNGLATLEIGSGTLVSGNLATINWAHGTYFIKTETDPTGGTNYTISGTSQMLSVPYAFLAKDATSAWSLNGNTIGTGTAVMGTNDDVDLVLRRNGFIAGRLGFLNTALGEQALETGGTNTSFNTAIGVRSMFSQNMSGGSNTAVGANALGGVTSGGFNVAIGRNSMLGNLTGSNNVAVGLGALSSGSGTNNIGIGRDSQVNTVSGSNQIRMGNTAITLAAVQVAWTVTSDRKWKSNIKESNLGLDFIKQLKPVVYTRKDVELEGEKYVLKEKTSNPTTEYGFIAQEVEETLNKFDTKNNGIISKGDDGMYGVRYNDLIAPMVKAMQEQQAIIEALTRRIAALEASQKR